jgi:hypothetical protein
MRNTYYLNGPFDLDILSLEAACSSGSPTIASGDRFAGFLSPEGGRVHSDGKTVTLEAPKGQSILAAEGGDEDEQWALYNSLVQAPSPPPAVRQAFWFLPEYVTWVEQKYDALHAAKGPQNVGMMAGKPRECLSEASVRSFVARIKKLGLPPGKLVLDDGWAQQSPNGGHTDGYWNVDTSRFPDMPGLCSYLAKEGFVPGLWFGLPVVPGDAAVIADRPDLFEAALALDSGEVDTQRQKRYFKPSPALVEFYRSIFSRFIAMGFRKFKLDFFGGPRVLIREIYRCAYQAISSIDPTVEVEGHQPDVFASRWTHSVRMQDVLVNAGVDWAGLTLAHYRVARLSAAGRIINLDHAGGNEPKVGAKDYMRNLRLFDLVEDDTPRYPVVSLLPDHFAGAEPLAELKRYLAKHTQAMKGGIR